MGVREVATLTYAKTRIMKRTIFTLLLYLSMTSLAFGQRTKIVTYNYDKQVFVDSAGNPSTEASWIRKRDVDIVLLKIINANGMAFNVTIDGKAIEVNPGDSGVSFVDALTGNLQQDTDTETGTDSLSVGEALNEVGLLQNNSNKDNQLISLQVAKNQFNGALRQLKSVSILKLQLEDQILRGSLDRLNINENTDFDSDSYREYLQEFRTLLNDLVNSTIALKKEWSKTISYLTVQEYISESKKMDQLLAEFDLEKSTEDLNKFLGKIQAYEINDNEFSYPMQVGKADQLEFTTKIELKEAYKDKIKLKSLADPLTINVYGQPKINTSTGLFFTNVIDHAFDVREVDDTENNLEIFREDEGAFKSSGVGALIHYYTTPRNNVQLGWSLGTMINTAGRIRYLTGPSLILGTENRVIISAGIAGGEVTRLSGGLFEGARISDPQSLVTNQRFEVGGFLAFTYNLSKK